MLALEFQASFVLSMSRLTVPVRLFSVNCTCTQRISTLLSSLTTRLRGSTRRVKDALLVLVNSFQLDLLLC